MAKHLVRNHGHSDLFAFAILIRLLAGIQGDLGRFFVGSSIELL